MGAFGRQVFDRLLTQRSQFRLGNTVFVHGGLDDRMQADAFIAPPWTAGIEARWAWITAGFVDGQSGFGGTLAVHGHIPLRKHSALTGSPLTGIVAARKSATGATAS